MKNSFRISLFLVFFTHSAISQEVNAEKVISNYFEAIGGKNTIESIQSIQTTAKTKMGPYQVRVQMTHFKNGTYCEMTYFNDELQGYIFFNDSSGYEKSNGFSGGKESFSEDDLKYIKADRHPFPELEMTATYDGTEIINGELAYKLIMSNKSINYYSRETGLKLKTIPPSGRGSTTFKDYKEMDGVLFPSKREGLSYNSKKDWEIEMKLNEDFSMDCE